MYRSELEVGGIDVNEMMNKGLEHDWASLAAGSLVMRRLVE